MSEPNSLAEISITIEGNSNAISFSALTINQHLADVNDFSFNWRQEEGAGSLSAYVSFNREYLAKEVTININNNFTFKGIVFGINCVEQDINGITYEIIGKGLFAKLLETPACNTFYHKDLHHIFNTLNITSGTTLQLNPRNTNPLFYTVQYNQSAFNFYKMLAVRYGEWLFYNGQELVLGAISGSAVTISDAEIDNLNFSSRIAQPPINAVGYDTYQGTPTESAEQVEQPDGTGFIAASLAAGSSVITPSEFSNYSYSGAANSDMLSVESMLLQQGRAASSTAITGTTYNSRIKLAGKIDITDDEGNSFGEYIITSLNHFCSGPSNYQNSFSAVPSEVPVPPYTNPLVHGQCPAQIAIVVDNEDEDGQDRIKVRFPWQASTETTPWLDVVVPQAGPGYGFRFLPEIDDVVFIDFLANNPERPIVVGSVRTDNRRSDAAHEGNHVKIIGTRSGRRLELDDDQGVVVLRDNLRGNYPKNILVQTNSESGCGIGIQSQAGDNSFTGVVLEKDESIKLFVLVGGDPKAEITMEKDGSKIQINAKGNIEMKAEGDLIMSGANVKISARQDVKIEAGSAAKITSPQSEVEGTATAILKGLAVEVTGDTSAKMSSVATEMSSSGNTMITGALVMIN